MRRAGKVPSTFFTCGRAARESKKTSPWVREGGARGALLRISYTPDSCVLHRLMPRQHDDFARRCTIFLRGLTAGPRPVRHHLAPPSSSPACVSSKLNYFSAFGSEVAISSAFLASRTEKPGNFQNCRTIARRAMPAKKGGGG